MGRPPLKRGVETKMTGVRLTADMHARIVALVGKTGMAAFLREAAERELKRRKG